MHTVAGVEPWIRGVVFVVVFVALLIAQYLAPRGAQRPVRALWPNAALFVTNTSIMRLLSTYSLVGVAYFASEQQIGLLNAMDIAPWLEAAAAVLALDLTMYLQHRLFHTAALLWRFHAVHHSDTTFDVTTGLRFHPGEMIVSLAIKALAVVVLGASPWSVLVFEALLSSASLFTHSNVALPRGLDRLLRACVVTSDMHRIHHSTQGVEYNTNFGFLVSWWDRWFGSYCAEPHEHYERVRIGLESFRNPNEQTFRALLLQPLQPR